MRIFNFVHCRKYIDVILYYIFMGNLKSIFPNLPWIDKVVVKKHP